MANSFTTNLNLTKPEVGADTDAWGGHLNSDLDALDAMLAGSIYGLTLSTAGSSATFGIAAGGASGMALSSAYTKTTGSWAVGTGLGSVDTGTIANSTWYHVFLIQRTDTGVVDVLTSLSATSPTMPTNYTRKRRIGAMKTDGSAHWTLFTQVGNEFLWGSPVQDYNTTALSTTPAVVAMSVPTGIQVIARIRGAMASATPGTGILFTSPDETSAAVSVAGGNVSAVAAVASVGSGYTVDVRTNTSAQIRVVASAASTTLFGATYGWIDPRGQW